MQIRYFETTASIDRRRTYANDAFSIAIRWQKYRHISMMNGMHLCKLCLEDLAKSILTFKSIIIKGKDHSKKNDSYNSKQTDSKNIA